MTDAEKMRAATAKVVPDHGVILATVRNGEDEFQIECRFRDGQKFAAATVDSQHEALAHAIASYLSSEPVGDTAALVTRLRNLEWTSAWVGIEAALSEAADTIERLEARIAELEGK